MNNDYTISTEKPPNYDLLHEKFGVEWDAGLVVTYGKTIHCKFPLPKYLIAHEEVHVMQQEKMGAEAWWKQYLEDGKFRLTEETAAYIVQADFIRKAYLRPTRRELLRGMVKSMVKMYGGMCSKAQAREILGI